MRYSPKSILLSLTAILLIGTAAVSAVYSYAAGGAFSEGGAVQVSIKLFSFNPGVIEVPVGTKVVWTNGDAIEHSVTSGVPGTPGGAFDSGFFTEGQTWSFTFDEPGEYPYFCKRHNFMRGVVKVVPKGE